MQRNFARLWPWLVLAAMLAALMPQAALAQSASTTTSVNIPWYLSRATGITAYLLLFVTVLLGLSIHTHALDRLVARWRVTDIHTFLSVVVMVFVLVHAGALLGDSFIGFSVVQILVPFASSYLPIWTGLGICMMYLMLIVLISFPLRRFTGYRFWRSLHYLTFVVYVGALAHAIFTGTDSRTGWAQLLYLSTSGLLLGLIVYRILSWRRRELATLAPRLRPRLPQMPAGAANALRQRMARARPEPEPIPLEVLSQRQESIETRALAFSFGAVILAMLLILGAGTGPFRWGQSTVTPLAASTDSQASAQTGAAAPATGGAAAPAQAAQAQGFQEPYNGTIAGGGRGGALDLHLQAQGTQSVVLDIRLRVARGDDGGGNVTGNRAVLTDSNGATLCSGNVTALDDTGFQIACQGAGPYAGQQLTLDGTIDGLTGSQIQGTLQLLIGAPNSG